MNNAILQVRFIEAPTSYVTQNPGSTTTVARLAEQEEARRRAEAEETAKAQRLADAEEAARQGVPPVGDCRSASARPQAAPAFAPAPPQSQAPAMAQAHGEDERARMSAVLVGCLRGKRAAEVAAELLDGTFHPAVTIDLSRL
jgi:hypothetical protein